MLLLVGTLFALSSCGKKKEEGPILVPPSPSWACTFTQEKDVFDRNEVYLTFTCKDFTIQRYLYQDFDPKIYSVDYEEGTDQYKSWYDNALALYEEKRKRCPEYIELYYGMKGEEYFIKSITELTFAAETAFAPWTYTERLQVPAELFEDEYGLIRFGWKFMPQDKDEKAGLYCAFYYKKTGNTVQISKEDLAPKVDYSGNEYAVSTRQNRTDYCEIKKITPDSFRPDNTDGDLTIEYFLGRTYPKEEGYVSTKLYFVSERTGEKGRIMLKEIDYSVDHYSCDVVYDYDGVAKYVLFNYKETLTIPKEYVTGEERVGIFLYGKKSQEEKEEPISFALFKYTHYYNDDPEKGHLRDEYARNTFDSDLYRIDEEKLKKILRKK